MLNVKIYILKMIIVIVVIYMKNFRNYQNIIKNLYKNKGKRKRNKRNKNFKKQKYKIKIEEIVIKLILYKIKIEHKKFQVKLLTKNNMQIYQERIQIHKLLVLKIQNNLTLIALIKT